MDKLFAWPEGGFRDVRMLSAREPRVAVDRMSTMGTRMPDASPMVSSFEA